ncbi:MAG: hypothetical protein GY714_31560 [Desulfobacterales bacterium]|nr:hypothetical protein [Desulfobacterales bacterium]
MLNIIAKQKYDDMRSELNIVSFSKVQINSGIQKLIIEARTKWTEKYSKIDGPHSNMLKGTKLKPTVSNLINIFTYKLPDYSFFSMDFNRKSIEICKIQSIVFPVSIDNLIYVSDKKKIAIIRVQKNVILLFSDEESGLQEAMYIKKK